MVWAVLGVLLIALILVVSRFCYRIAFYSLNEKEQDIYVIPPGEQYEALSDEILEMIHEVDQLPYELFTITARDGLHLAARYYHFYDGAPVQILFHGYRGNGIREFSGNHRLAKKLGFNCLVVDERAHGKSGGHTITFGIKERLDCVDWVSYARDRFGEDTQIFLSGVSMGAATVLMASELLSPGQVAAVTADCPYSSPGRIIRKVTRDVGLPPYLAYPFVMIGALVFGRFCLWKSSPLESVRHTRIPILLIHGEDDRFVPCDMSRDIHAAAPDLCRLYTVPGAGHGLSYPTDPAGYEKVYGDFLKSCEIQIKNPTQ